MSRIIVLLIGFIAGWLFKDGEWKVWLKKLESAFTPQEKSEHPIPLHENQPEQEDTSTEVIPNNLEELKGIGPASQMKLNENGIHTFAQVAALSPEELKAIVGARVNADAVIAQAKELAA